MRQASRAGWSGTLGFLTAFSLVVAVGLAALGVKSLLDGYPTIAVFAFLAAMGIGVHGVARILLLTERKDEV